MTTASTDDKIISTALFADLEEALTLAPDHARVYAVYSRVYQRCVDEKVSRASLHFSGTFAKTDYLIKEYQVPRQLANDINDTRNRLRRRTSLTEEELLEHSRTDLENICQFIAHLYQCAIPASLQSHFRQQAVHAHSRTLISECMRVVTDHWDERYIYALPDEGSDMLKVCYAGSEQERAYNKGDWSYLEPMLYQYAQLNLVRPREEDGVIYPELIILEPDYLVDISAVARCFTNYTEGATAHLLHRLSPSQVTEPIVLGNLAGQLLDDALHHQDDGHTYADSVKTFFQHNAATLLTVDLSPQFHKEAQRQKANIEHALHEALPEAIGHFQSSEGMVEPSFFSEMLGLQGRMDYLQWDMKVLMEQKSGKGEFPYDNFRRPRYKEEHYVQLLLYMALIRYNYREKYEDNGRELHAFLLYTKYDESLDGHGFAPDLIFRAFRVRNEIVWRDMQYAHPDGYKVLDTLTPDSVNSKHATNMLWLNYQRRQVAELLAPIHQASDLERAYYYRMLTFVANEHVLSKLGNCTKENSGFASKWHDSIEEKLLAGNIYNALTLVPPEKDSEGTIKEVTLQFAETPDNDMANFRVGDVVVLYPYDAGEEPDIRRTMVFRCNIKDIQTDSITLLLRASQSDPRIFTRYIERSWAIEHDFIESSYDVLYRGIHAFLSAPQERRDLLLMQREPRVDRALTLRGDYGAFNELALRVKQAQDLFLIIGPPGTGKTSFGMLNTVKEELLEPDGTVLLMSYTNRAVDEICSKLKAEGIEYIRIGSELNCAVPYRDHLLRNVARSCNRVSELRERFLAVRVVVGTTATLSACIPLLTLKHFTLGLIDEASQILEPHLIGLLGAHSGGTAMIDKIVMIGDHKQLPAVVQQQPAVSSVDHPLLNAICLTDCRLSLFERLLRRYGTGREDVTYMLTRQGRMHHDIAEFPNHAFYNGLLTEVPLPHQLAVLTGAKTGTDAMTALLTTRRIAFINAPRPTASPSDKVNQSEADIIAALVVRIYEMEKERFDADSTVGVIVPYRNQIATVRDTIDHYGIPALHDITIDTVERYQGSQRRYIIYGFTVQRRYQLDFLTSNVFEDTDGTLVDRKLNVAMTRAQEHLIMVGNAPLLSEVPLYAQLIRYLGADGL